MNKKNLFYVLVLTLVLCLTNLFMIRTNLYWTTIWADMITHCMGGMMAAGIGIMCFDLKNDFDYRVRHVVLFGFLIGILWEVFELSGSITNIADSGYYIDTLKDLFFDSFGAYLTVLLLK